jgi:hypothetical protein
MVMGPFSKTLMRTSTIISRNVNAVSNISAYKIILSVLKRLIHRQIINKTGITAIFNACRLLDANENIPVVKNRVQNMFKINIKEE